MKILILSLLSSQIQIWQSNLIKLYLFYRNNVTVVERDYGSLGLQLEFADVIVDENTCVLIYDLADFKEQVDLEPISLKVLAMRQKFQMCWLLMLFPEEQKAGYVQVQFVIFFHLVVSSR